MPVVTLPDGKKLDFEKPVVAAEVVYKIGPGLAKAALAIKIVNNNNNINNINNNKLVDLDYIIDQNISIQVITAKDPEGLEILRHSCAHLMAQAVQQLFPQAKVTIGPVIEDGFFYDFSYEKSFTPEDLITIEKKMAELAKQDLKVSRKILSRDKAIDLFKNKKENYKVEIINDIPGDQELSFYSQGDFIDLCRGPHVPRTSLIKAFKLMKLAGAYWRGDSNNEMLQRIYGTAWATEKELKKYLYRLEEAEKRDHRKLAKKYNLFHQQEEAPGMVFWHPKGWVIVQVIKEYIRNKILAENYKEVNTPQLIDRRLWERSGHWEKFRENMFTLTSDDYHHAIKPMNCPGHIQIYNQGVKSYRDLPLRMAEFGSCHRYEPSGALHGLMRLRNFVQDDGHIFCTEEQVQQEVLVFIKLLYEIYKDFGFEDIIVRLSTRPDKRVGSDQVWDKSESALESAIKQANLKYDVFPGEGAFYGPKIEFSLRDCLGRVWQCGTIQVDFSMPERLDAQYVAEDGSKLFPVMLHRAILGSIERFIGILIEETSGSLPVWLAPVQAVIMNISDSQAEFVRYAYDFLQNNGVRVDKDLRNEKIGFKIREHTIQRVPYLLVIGDRESESQTVSVRTLEGQDLGCMNLIDFVSKIKDKVVKRRRKEPLAQEKKPVIV